MHTCRAWDTLYFYAYAAHGTETQAEHGGEGAYWANRVCIVYRSTLTLTKLYALTLNHNLTPKPNV